MTVINNIAPSELEILKEVLTTKQAVRTNALLGFLTCDSGLKQTVQSALVQKLSTKHISRFLRRLKNQGLCLNQEILWIFLREKRGGGDEV